MGDELPPNVVQTEDDLGDIPTHNSSLQPPRSKRGSIIDHEVAQEHPDSWHHVAITKKGYVPYDPSKQNQDTYIVMDELEGDPDVRVFGVCDGHGQYGHMVAGLVKKSLPKYLGQNIKDLKSGEHVTVKLAITEACRLTSEELREALIDCRFSGTTLVFSVFVGDWMYTANVGDSRCVMGSFVKEAIQPNAMSNDQKPDSPGEYERITATGGRVQPLPGPPDEDCGPMRVWLANVDVPGLAMSRSIGDWVSKQVGVIDIPEIIQHELKNEDIFCIWATDGVWEFLENKVVIDHLAKYIATNDMRRAAKKIVSKSVKKWRAEEEVIDDITAVIVQFRKMNEP